MEFSSQGPSPENLHSSQTKISEDKASEDKLWVNFYAEGMLVSFVMRKSMLSLNDVHHNTVVDIALLWGDCSLVRNQSYS